MGFHDVVANVEKTTGLNNMRKTLQKENQSGAETMSFEKMGYIRWIKADKTSETTEIFFEDENGKKQVFNTNKSEAFFQKLIDKKVYVSGVFNTENSKLYIASCYLIENREDKINTCDLLSEEDKISFVKKTQVFTPSLQEDLADKYIRLYHLENDETKAVPLYKTIDELKALYDVLKKAIPVEFRAEYEACSKALEKTMLSNPEKKNYQKVISEILSIDWTQQHFKEVDVDKALDYIRERHIGHFSQINQVKKELLAYNFTQKAPKTFLFVGQSCGCSTFAHDFAKALGKEYAEIDFSGVRATDTDKFTGTSRVYENGEPGLIFEKIKEVGPYGVLIIKNVDQYSEEMLKLIDKILRKEKYTDLFMQIPISLSNLWVICTSSTAEHVPKSIRESTHELYFEKLSEEENFEVINKIFLRKYCSIYGINLTNEIPENVCRKIFYQLGHMDQNKVEMIVRAVVLEVAAEGTREFPLLDIDMLKKYYDYDVDTDKLLTKFVTELAEMEQKFYGNYNCYPDSVRSRANELLEKIRYGDDGNEKSYELQSLKHLVNVTKGDRKRYEWGQITAMLKDTHYMQEELAKQIEAALMAESLTNSNSQTTVIGLYGGPGTGKTSVAEALATCLGRSCVRINFGGSDSTVIKGRNKAIPNAQPSYILRELAKNGGTYNSVLIIDEVDKGNHDSYDALYEFLDGTKKEWYDEFLQCNIPKGDFIVVLTFNDISQIPRPIVDRMRLIRLEGYTTSEKKIIAKEYILKKYAEKMDLKNVSITDDALKVLMNEYAINPGIRDLEKDIERIIVHVVKNAGKTEIVITSEDVRVALGSKRTRGLDEMGEQSAATVGQAMALAVMGDIGCCCAVQVVKNPYQQEQIKATGRLEGSCLESLSVAVSLSHRALKKELPKLHVHFLDPACEKSGASAGTTLYMAIMSCLLDKGLEDCAFTGTLDLYGNVGIIGGIQNKLIAAERSGIKKVYIPQENYNELEEKNEMNRFDLEVIPMKHVDDVTKELFGFVME